MSVQLERLITRLVDEGNAALAQPRQPAEFAYDPDADAILNDIEQYPQAFVLACLCNRQGMARRAWMVPLRLLDRFRTLNVGELAQRSKSASRARHVAGHRSRLGPMPWALGV